MRNPKHATKVTFQELSTGEWMAYGQVAGIVKTLSAKEVEVYNLCDGVRSLEQIATESGLAPQECNRLVELLTSHNLLLDDSLPKASPGLVASKIVDETVVFDPKTSAVHHLTPLVSRVYEACQNQESFEDVREDISARFGDEAAEEGVASSLVELESAGLISIPRNFSRRSFLSTSVKAAALVGISSILAPTAAQAASNCSGCLPLNTCSGSLCGQCCDGNAQGENCTGARVCNRYQYSFLGGDLFAADFSQTCTQMAGFTFFNDCEDLCSELPASFGFMGCCNLNVSPGALVPGPNQPVNGPCVLCGNKYSGSFCPEGYTCCAAGSAGDGTCRRPINGPCSIGADCCSGNCNGTICVA